MSENLPQKFISFLIPIEAPGNKRNKAVGEYKDSYEIAMKTNDGEFWYYTLVKKLGSRCKGITEDGTRCERMTEHESGYCYQHR